MKKTAPQAPDNTSPQATGFAWPWNPTPVPETRGGDADRKSLRSPRLAAAPGKPTAEEILAARKAAGLTREEAAAVVWHSPEQWRAFEVGMLDMHPCTWWAFKTRVAMRSIPRAQPGPDTKGMLSTMQVQAVDRSDQSRVRTKPARPTRTPERATKTGGGVARKSRAN